MTAILSADELGSDLVLAEPITAVLIHARTRCDVQIETLPAGTKVRWLRRLHSEYACGFQASYGGAWFIYRTYTLPEVHGWDKSRQHKETE